MKLRRFLSLVTLAVYLTAMGGMCWSSITCPCVASVTGSGCSCRTADGDHLHLQQSDCCGHDHDGSVALYIHADQHRQGNKAFTMLCQAPAFVPDTVCGTALAARPFAQSDRSDLFRSDPFHPSAGLRAPPVQA